MSAREDEPLPDWSRWWRQGLLRAFPGLMKVYARTRYRAIVELLNAIPGAPPRGKRLLELGAGTGTISELLTRETGVAVTLLDNNPEAQRLFRKLAGRHGEYVFCDAFEYAPAEPFDIVFSDGLIEHFREPERKRILEAHRRLAKAGGHAIVFVPKDSWFVRNVFYMRGGFELKYRFDQLEKELRDAGLRPIARAEDWHMIGVLCEAGG